MTWEIREGDCVELLKDVSADSVSLVVTSPPYADQRKDTYGGVHPDKYVEWWLPISEQLKRVLTLDGTLIVNIKEKVVAGERHLYVLDMIRAMRKQGWLWTEEFIWHKRNSTPGKWPNRFRDGWERCLQFNRDRKFVMYQDAVREPVGDWASSRMGNLSDNDKQRMSSAVGSGFGRNVSNWQGRDTVYPDNVLHLATECANVGHSAAYPVALPLWFIKLFTQRGDLVLDPFSGSGTTGVSAVQLGRQYLGLELLPAHVTLSRERLAELGEPDPDYIDELFAPPPPKPAPEPDPDYIDDLFGSSQRS
jgi:site-specific DNA-methyltransferase (adenine-specific)